MSHCSFNRITDGMCRINSRKSVRMMCYVVCMYINISMYLEFVWPVRTNNGVTARTDEWNGDLCGGGCAARFADNN